MSHPDTSGTANQILQAHDKKKNPVSQIVTSLSWIWYAAIVYLRGVVFFLIVELGIGRNE